MLINTVEKFNAIRENLLECLTPTVDTETSGLIIWGNSNKDPDVLIGIAIRSDTEAYYLPFRHIVGQNLPLSLLTDSFLPKYLSNPDRTYIGFNYKFDTIVMNTDGIPVAPNYEDVMFALHLLNENEPNFQLKDTCDRYGIGDGSLQEQILQDKIIAACHEMGIRVSIDKKDPDYWKSKMKVLPPEDVEPYACEDVNLTKTLRDLLVPALQHNELYDLWKQINYYSYITSMMEIRGIQLNVPLMKQYAEEAQEHIEEAQELLNKIAGYPVNANSSPQICALLQVDSSAAEVLEVLAEREDETGKLAKAVIGCRGWKSVDSRYYQPYLSTMDIHNTLHTNLNLIGTISGRLSSNNPNLQAVARSTNVFKVKDVFVAREGFTLVSADYSQAEMRLASWYANEQGMAELIRQGKDIHGSTAETLGIPRDAAKRINFGVIYGIGKAALSKQLRIPEAKAAEYLNKYHELYPNFRRFARKCENIANENGYITMWTGRKRHYDQNNPTHKAMSNIIQGGVSEIMRTSISKLFPMVQDISGYMILQVHDQIIFEVPTDTLEYAVPMVSKVMSDFEFDPKLIVDIKFGQCWGGMIKHKPDLHKTQEDFRKYLRDTERNTAALTPV